jgi:hypothetical protein
MTRLPAPLALPTAGGPRVVASFSIIRIRR